MFAKFRKDKIKLDQISEYKEAIKVVKYFLAVGEWEKTKQGIKEIKEKEKESYFESIEKIDNSKNVDEKLKTKALDIYNKKIKEISKIEAELSKKKRLYHESEDKKRIKIRFGKVKSRLDDLRKVGKFQEGLNLLHVFLEENKGSPDVIKYYNKERKVFLKHIARQKDLKKKKSNNSVKEEALKLIGADGKMLSEDTEDEKPKNLLEKIKRNINIYKAISDRLKRKKLLDEVTLLIDEDNKASNDIAKKKLANMHRGLVKEIKNDSVLGYDIYGKILGQDKISGDVVGFQEKKDDYIFYIGDATGHGVRAGLIVTQLTRTFNKFAKKAGIKKLTFEVNNSLKQNLSSRNFITGVFFGIEKKAINRINYVGMGHEPMFLFKNESQNIEKIIPGGLAAGIRLIDSIENVKAKSIDLDNKDMMLCYSDGIVEAKNIEGECYGMDRLKEVFLNLARLETKIENIYEEIMTDVRNFKGSSSFVDDATILIVRRNNEKDVPTDENTTLINEIQEKENLEKKELKRLKGKSKNQIEQELKKIKKEKETASIIKVLEGLYYTGEILRLKQECTRYIKEGYVHKKINHYLKLAQDNEVKYKVAQREIKVMNKFNVLKELLNKGDYETVINEAEDIIAKDGLI